VRRAALALLVALAIGSGAGVLTYHLRSDQGAVPASPERVRAVRIDRADAIARVTRLAAQVRRVDRVEARMTQWSAIPGYAPTRPGETAGDYCVWAVAVAGDIVAFGGGHYAWGVYKVDAASGEIAGTTAGSGSWPTWVDDLSDSC
jgi:hypothetical protein